MNSSRSHWKSLIAKGAFRTAFEEIWAAVLDGEESPDAELLAMIFDAAEGDTETGVAAVLMCSALDLEEPRIGFFETMCVRGLSVKNSDIAATARFALFNVMLDQGDREIEACASLEEASELGSHDAQALCGRLMLTGDIAFPQDEDRAVFFRLFGLSCGL